MTELSYAHGEVILLCIKIDARNMTSSHHLRNIEFSRGWIATRLAWHIWLACLGICINYRSHSKQLWFPRWGIMPFGEVWREMTAIYTYNLMMYMLSKFMRNCEVLLHRMRDEDKNVKNRGVQTLLASPFPLKVARCLSALGWSAISRSSHRWMTIFPLQSSKFHQRDR